MALIYVPLWNSAPNYGKNVVNYAAVFVKKDVGRRLGLRDY